MRRIRLATAVCATSLVLPPAAGALPRLWHWQGGFARVRGGLDGTADMFRQIIAWLASIVGGAQTIAGIGALGRPNVVICCGDYSSR